MPVPARDLARRIHQLAAILDRRADSELRRHLQVSIADIQLLLLVRRGTATQHQVATLTGVTPAAVSRKIEELSQRQLIIRRSNPVNRRAHVLTLTRRGRRLVQRSEGILTRALALPFHGMTAAERRQLVLMLETITQATHPISPHQRSRHSL